MESYCSYGDVGPAKWRIICYDWLHRRHACRWEDLQEVGPISNSGTYGDFLAELARTLTWSDYIQKLDFIFSPTYQLIQQK